MQNLRVGRISLEELESALAAALAEITEGDVLVRILKYEATGDESSRYTISLEVSELGSNDLEPVGAHLVRSRSSTVSEEEPPATYLTLDGVTGKHLNSEWNVGAKHALYHKYGRWYHQLRHFPGALFDLNGYVLFDSRESFLANPEIVVTQDVHVPKGLASHSAYVRVRRAIMKGNARVELGS
jgi:hypothetical protein